MELTDPIIIILLYLAPINIISFYLMGSDKRKAINRKRRIPEKTLFLWAIIGGSIGSMLGMKTFRHKTRHLSFSLGIPLIFLVEATMATMYIIPNLF